MPSFGALSPCTVPDDPVPLPYKGSLSQQDCISDSPGDHGQTTGRLGALGTPQSLYPLPFGSWLLSSPQSQEPGLEPHWWARLWAGTTLWAGVFTETPGLVQVLTPVANIPTGLSIDGPG